MRPSQKAGIANVTMDRRRMAWSGRRLRRSADSMASGTDTSSATGPRRRGARR